MSSSPEPVVGQLSKVHFVDNVIGTQDPRARQRSPHGQH